MLHPNEVIIHALKPEEIEALLVEATSLSPKHGEALVIQTKRQLPYVSKKETEETK